MNKQSIDQEFGFFSLVRFAFPSIIMMLFMALYSIADGIFISRLVGSMALSAINIIFPAASVLMALGIMLASGGSAVIAKKLGEKKEHEANENFTMLILVAVGIGLFGLVIGTVFFEKLCRVLGATDLQLVYSCAYLQVMLLFAPICMLQMLFQSFFVTASRPELGLLLTVAAGGANMGLDYLFMGPLQMGVAGAALATGLGQCIPALTGVVYFVRNKKGLHVTRPCFDGQVLRKTCLNGASEMVTNISSAVVTWLFNMVMLRLARETGVAAITVVLYGQFLFCSLYLGFGIGVAPVFSYNYGARNQSMLKKVYTNSMKFTVNSSLLLALAAFFGAPVVARMFLDSDTAIYELTCRGCMLFSGTYLVCDVNILASGIFTALSDGRTSALISFLRTFVFLVGAILLLPLVLGTDGVWLSVPLAEFLTLAVSVRCLWKRFGKKSVEISALFRYNE